MKHDELFFSLSLEYLIIYAILTMHCMRIWTKWLHMLVFERNKVEKKLHIFEIRAHKTVLIVNGTRNERKKKRDST